jgi:hypothetical protein
VDIDSSRQDLAAANAALDAILARELEATDTAASFGAWRAECDAATSEVDRLTKLLDRLEAVAGEAERQAQAAALAKRADTQRQANEALARRISAEGGPAIEKLLELARDIATASMVDEALNSALPDAERVVSADALARLRTPTPRENISEKAIDLWVFARSGAIVGNQDDVNPTRDGSTGLIRGSQTRAVKRKFRSITYREAESRQPLVPFFAALGCHPRTGRDWFGIRVTACWPQPPSRF